MVDTLIPALGEGSQGHTQLYRVIEVSLSYKDTISKTKNKQASKQNPGEIFMKISSLLLTF